MRKEVIKIGSRLRYGTIRRGGVGKEMVSLSTPPRPLLSKQAVAIFLGVAATPPSTEQGSHASPEVLVFLRVIHALFTGGAYLEVRDQGWSFAKPQLTRR